MRVVKTDAARLAHEAAVTKFHERRVESILIAIFALEFADVDAVSSACFLRPFYDLPRAQCPLQRSSLYGYERLCLFKHRLRGFGECLRCRFAEVPALRIRQFLRHALDVVHEFGHALDLPPNAVSHFPTPSTSRMFGSAWRPLRTPRARPPSPSRRRAWPRALWRRYRWGFQRSTC